jgi:hypothetical protein
MWSLCRHQTGKFTGTTKLGEEAFHQFLLLEMEELREFGNSASNEKISIQRGGCECYDCLERVPTREKLEELIKKNDEEEKKMVDKKLRQELKKVQKRLSEKRKRKKSNKNRKKKCAKRGVQHTMKL